MTHKQTRSAQRTYMFHDRFIRSKNAFGRINSDEFFYVIKSPGIDQYSAVHLRTKEVHRFDYKTMRENFRYTSFFRAMIYEHLGL